MEIAHFKNIRKAILNSLDNAKERIQIAVCWFTNQELFNKICDKIGEGIEVELIILNDFINNREDGLEFQKFIDSGGVFFYDQNDRPMHNKYCIIDEKTLINGSYNWTYYAENKNEENIIVHSEKGDLIKCFVDDFDRLKNISTKVNKVSKYSIVEIADNNVFGTHNYLAQDYLYKAKETNNLAIVEKAFKLTPTNIEIQKKAVEYNLKMKRRTKSSIGESVHGNKFSAMIPKGTEIPYSKKHTFTTVENNQRTCEITVKYGESPWGSKNVLIGDFTIRGIPPMKAREPKLDTTFSIDIFGILRVSKHIRGTNNVTTMRFDIKNLLEEINE